MFSVSVSIAADAILDSVSSSVFRLTRYDIDFRALFMSCFSCICMSFTDFIRKFIENVVDSIIDATIM